MSMSTIRSIAAVAALATLALIATTRDSHAATIAPVPPLVRVGVQFGTPYIQWTGLASSSCPHGVMYVNSAMGNDAAIARAHSAILAAYLSGRGLTRIDYLQDSSSCRITLVEF